MGQNSNKLRVNCRVEKAFKNIGFSIPTHGITEPLDYMEHNVSRKLYLF
jgi:hypothetical protein